MCTLTCAIAQKHSPPHPSNVSQFEKGILDACIYILDAAHMPIKKRADLLSVIRKASAMVRNTFCLQLPSGTARHGLARPGQAWSGRHSLCFTVCVMASVDPEDASRRNCTELD